MFNGVNPVQGPVAVVTSISNGAEHCARRLVYPAISGSAKPKVIDFGNACDALAADFPKAPPMKTQVQTHTVQPANNGPI